MVGVIVEYSAAFTIDKLFQRPARVTAQVLYTAKVGNKEDKARICPLSTQVLPIL